jgi:hypothetical protein
MAIYFDSVDKDKCPVRGLTVGDEKIKVNFSVDNISDIDNLPGLDKVRGGSTAFVINSSQLYMLSSGGWRAV